MCQILRCVLQHGKHIKQPDLPSTAAIEQAKQLGSPAALAPALARPTGKPCCLGTIAQIVTHGLCGGL